jgi:hypothetical protein
MTITFNSSLATGFVTQETVGTSEAPVLYQVDAGTGTGFVDLVKSSNYLRMAKTAQLETFDVPQYPHAHGSQRCIEVNAIVDCVGG